MIHSSFGPKAISKTRSEKKVHLNQSRCLKRCGDGLHLIAAHDAHHFTKIKRADANRIVDPLVGKKSRMKKTLPLLFCVTMYCDLPT